MTVGELIAILSRCDLDRRVLVGSGYPWQRPECHVITEPGAMMRNDRNEHYIKESVASSKGLFPICKPEGDQFIIINNRPEDEI